MAFWTVFKEEKRAALPILREFVKGHPVRGYEKAARSLVEKLGKIDIPDHEVIMLSGQEEDLIKLMLRIYPELYESQPDWIYNPTRPEDL